MLPHFVWKDFLDVVADVRRAGIAIEAEWFAPHFEFRFPLYGAVEHAGATIELRQALEPWHVMGEEGAIGGTVRYVDSSVERVRGPRRGTTAGGVLACNRQRYRCNQPILRASLSPASVTVPGSRCACIRRFRLTRR